MQVVLEGGEWMKEQLGLESKGELVMWVGIRPGVLPVCWKPRGKGPLPLYLMWQQHWPEIF